MKKVKIIADGIVQNTKIIDIETGCEIQGNVKSAHITIDAQRHVVDAVLVLQDVALDIECGITETQPPIKGYFGA